MTTINTYQYPDGKVVQTAVSCKTEPGLGLTIIGLANEKIKNAILRTATALMFTGYRLPGKKTIIEVLPEADKSNPVLIYAAIALAIRESEKDIRPDFFVVGELGLDASARSSVGIKEIAEYHTKHNPDRILFIPACEDVPESNCVRHFSKLSEIKTE